MSKPGDKHLNFLDVTAIGVGGMVGGGIFAVLGLSVQLTRGGAPVAFLIAGMVALVTSYSYARLSVTYPSQGGTVAFLDRAFGPGILTGSINILLWISYIVMLSLYAYAFGSYGASFFSTGSHLLWKHILITGSIVAITGLNLLNAKMIGEAEDWIVLLKLVILLLFIVVGIWGVDSSRLVPQAWSSPAHLVAGGMIIFLAYEGFELIANTAQDVRNARKTLPRAFYSSIGFVILLYVLVAIVTVGTLPVETIIHAKDYALAEAARPSLGQTGFSLIAVAAMLLGGDKALAVDLNPLCVKTALRNVAMNGLQGAIRILEGDVLDFAYEPADLVVANIHYDVMNRLMQIKGFLEKEWFIFSGLMRSQVRDLKSIMTKGGIEIIREWDHEMTWYTLLGKGPVQRGGRRPS